MQAYFIESTVGTGLVVAESEEKAKDLFFADVTNHKVNASIVEITNIYEMDKETCDEDGVKIDDTAYVFDVTYL